MIQRPPSRSADENARLDAFLRENDPLLPQPPLELAALEGRIMAGIDDLTARTLEAETILPPWMISKSWLSRSAWMSGAFVVMLGFIVGRGFGDGSSPASDQATYFASADGTILQTFLANPGLPGDMDDTSE